MPTTMTNKLLYDFCLDTEDAVKNYELASWYEKQGHTAPALTYYLRTAERCVPDTYPNKILVYSSLIKAAFCYRFQGSRDGTEKVLLENALTLFPERPEAYYFLSLLYERRKDWQNSYIYASLGVLRCTEDLIRIEWSGLVNYPGKYALIFQKAVAAWWWGKGQECRELLQTLLNEYWDQMDTVHQRSVEENIIKLGAGPASVAFAPYKKKHYKKLRHKFPGSRQIEKNHSQVCQDMFILSMLNGKRNGTYLEIGSGDPFWGNNTALLEVMFDWKGIGIEWNEELVQKYRANRRNEIQRVNALEVNYDQLLSKISDSRGVIDYLQLDCEPASTTYEIMTKIPFDKYKFSVITYEHDYFVDVTRKYRDKSRKFLESKGYVLVANDLSPEGKCNFEDWWVHPDLIDPKILVKMTRITETPQAARDYILSGFNYPKNFDWSNMSKETISTIKREIVEEEVYRVFNDVKENDVVLDIGASVGAFTASILGQKPKKVYCIEPSQKLVQSLRYNCQESSCVVPINKGIVEKYGDQVFGFKATTFKDLLLEHKIDHVDFMKIDCEGGEYSIFMQENMEFLTRQVNFICMEIHLREDGFREKFKKMRDEYFPLFGKVTALSCTTQNIDYGKTVDITKQIYDNQFIDQYGCEFMVYLSNDEKRDDKKENVSFEPRFSSSSKPTVWVVDNFYDNPDQIRKFALEQNYIEGGFGRGFIGRRTEKQFLFPGLRERFEEVMGRKITAWQEHGMNGRFQIAWSGEPLVYHCDSQKWGGMIYLTPDAPYQCGTSLFAHKKTRARTYHDPGWDASWKDVPGDCHLDRTPFETVDVLGNVYNRLVIFDASCIHSASEYFGTVRENARLWQMFFFDTT